MGAAEANALSRASSDRAGRPIGRRTIRHHIVYGPSRRERNRRPPVHGASAEDSTPCSSCAGRTISSAVSDARRLRGWRPPRPDAGRGGAGRGSPARIAMAWPSSSGRMWSWTRGGCVLEALVDRADRRSGAQRSRCYLRTGHACRHAAAGRGVIELLLQAAERAGLLDAGAAAPLGCRGRSAQLAVVGLARVALQHADDAEGGRSGRWTSMSGRPAAGRPPEVYAHRGLPVPGTEAFVAPEAAPRRASAPPAPAAPAPSCSPPRPRRRRHHPQRRPRSVLARLSGGIDDEGPSAAAPATSAGSPSTRSWRPATTSSSWTTSPTAAWRRTARLQLGSKTATRRAPSWRPGGSRRDPPLRRPLARRREHAGPGEDASNVGPHRAAGGRPGGRLLGRVVGRLVRSDAHHRTRSFGRLWAHV